MDHQPNPPPPQAGKFKPRKPAKKISVGGVVPEAVTSIGTSVAAAANSTSQQRPRPSHGRGGRGGGRGTGRGSRAPIPQGKAFFTAQPAPQSGRGSHASQVPSTVTSSSIDNQPSTTTTTTLQQQRQSRRKRDDNNVGMDDEEIVGTLDEAVGYSLKISSNNIDKLGNHPVDNNNNSATGGSTANSNLERVLLGKTASSQPFIGPNGYVYDSDSSDDNDNNDETHDISVRNIGVQRPLTLPFPSTVGDGSRSKVALATNGKTASSVPVTKESKSQFPFFNTDKDAYFLVQLPTRLPPVVQKSDSTGANSANNNTSSINYNDPMAVNSDPEVRIVEPVAVATPAIQSNAFDNVLTNAKPGRIGTLKIYRSGKTVLVIDPPPSSVDTNDPIVLNVSEGLRCEFQQQAVSINLEQQTYIPFGNVNGTMVITPDF